MEVMCTQHDRLVMFYYRYKEGEVSLEKDVVMPYVANVEACDSNCLATSKLLRKTLLFFRGRIVRGSVLQRLSFFSKVFGLKARSADRVDLLSILETVSAEPMLH